MKRRHQRRSAYVPTYPTVAVVHCRACRAALTPALTLLTDVALLATEAKTPLVPEGSYWLVTNDLDFLGQFAVAPTMLVVEHYHAERARRMGCCGPSGNMGRNRLCTCGHEIGTERTDCLWAHAVYLDPAQITLASVNG